MIATPDHPESNAISRSHPANLQRHSGQRFWQLLELARAGEETAVADLFHEFGFRFGEV